MCVFFFSSRRRHTRFDCDWSSDVCSSDLRDHDRDQVGLPCEAPNAICVSATGPIAAKSVNGPWDNVDASALYTGYGRSVVSVAAPGGQRFTNTRVWVPCLTTPSSTSPAACRIPPMCPKPSAGTCLNQGIGTSFAAAHTSGLAALLDRKSTRLNSSHSQISYAVFCLKKKMS